MSTALAILKVLRALPLMLVLRIAPADTRLAIDRDIRRLHQQRLDLPLPERYTREQLVEALNKREFRSVLYERLRLAGGAPAFLGLALKRLLPGQVGFEMSCADIGPGLILSHGMATIVAATRIGTDCLVSQQVSIGWTDAGGPPAIGDRVRIGAGALVLGPITVGDDAVVGAGAVVIEDVPPGAVVAGVPARVIEGARDKFGARSADT